MPILSFSSNDIDVITGKKTRTIRKAWKTPLKVGDRLYCYWNLVSKEKMKIFEAFVTGIETISFDDIVGNDELAIEEGFKDSNEMLKRCMVEESTLMMNSISFILKKLILMIGKAIRLMKRP
jgi:hypothetical protein